MRVALCCLAKNEHEYINDFVKWYVGIGFDTIYIYDNDNIDSPSIKDRIDKNLLKKVVIIDIRGKKEEKMQQHIYNDFYKKYNKHFDWCLFCDVDEFLTNVVNIKLLLSLSIYRHYNQIRLKWRLYGDDNLITRDMNKPVYKVFKKEIKTSLMRDLDTKGNLENQGKFILRGGLKGIVITSPHFASYCARNNVVDSCLPSGLPCNSKIVIKENYDREAIYLNHYMTKSLSEFVKQKMGRNDAVYNCGIKLDYYWRINQKTQEKIDYLKGLGYEL